MRDKRQWLALAALLCIMVGGGAWYWWPQQPVAVPTPIRPIKKTAPSPAQEKPQGQTLKGDAGIKVAPITEITPRTVYSGDLGTLTGIQAAADIKKMQLEFAQLDAKVKELKKQPEPPMQALPLLPPRPSSSDMTQKTESSPRIVVLSVWGIGTTLTARLRTKDGTHTVKTGDDIPGFGTVQHISRDRVVVGGAAIPWK